MKRFEAMKTKANKICYSDQIEKYKDDIKKTWKIIKELIGKC